MTEMDHEKQNRLDKVKQGNTNKVGLSPQESDQVRESLYARGMNCPECGTRISDISRSEHEIRVHRRLICEDCGLEYFGSENKLDHFRRNCSKRIKTCETCDEDFIGSENLERHHAFQCPRECPLCLRGVSGDKALTSHIYTHCSNIHPCPISEIWPGHYLGYHEMSICSDCRKWVYGTQGHWCKSKNEFRY